MIQKEENVISLQASYLGKENLKKRIGEVSPGPEEAPHVVPMKRHNSPSIKRILQM